MATRQQFTVVLPPELIRRVQLHSLDARRSLSDLVTSVLEAYLSAEEADMTDQPPLAPAAGVLGGLSLQPMVHVEDMAEAVDFYHKLGGRVLQGSRDGDWALVDVGGAQLSLLAHPANPEQDEGVVELNFQYTGHLTTLEEHLRGTGVSIAAPTTDEGFGAQLQLRTPHGLLVKVNELDPDLYS